MDFQAREFFRIFEILPVTTSPELDHCQRLRYQVFCKEQKIFQQRHYPGHMESDTFDRRAVHRLIRYKPLGVFIATVRLILHDPLDPTRLFPLEQFEVVRNNIKNGGLQSRRSLGEISRFAISRQFWQASDLGATQPGIGLGGSRLDPTEIKRWYPYIILGLFRAVVQMSSQAEVQYWYSAMEPSLIRLLRRFGIGFTHLGPVVDYHGKRQPCGGGVTGVLAMIKQQRPDVYEFITGVDAVSGYPPLRQAAQTAGYRDELALLQSAG